MKKSAAHYAVSNLSGLWFDRLYATGRGAWLPVVGGVICLFFGTLTYLSLEDVWLGRTNNQFQYVLLTIDLFLVLGLVALVVRNIVKLVMERRRGAAGSRLHSRIAILFSLVAIVPVIMVATFSTIFFNFGVQTWFSDRVQTALKESKSVADAYVQEHSRVVRSDAIAIADYARTEQLLARFTQAELSEFLTVQVGIRNLSEAILFEETGRPIAQSTLSFSIALEGMPVWAVRDAQRGEVVLIADESDDRVRALIQVDPVRKVYLYIGRLLDPQVLGHASRVEEATDQFFLSEGMREGFKLTFAIFYAIIAMALLLIALWLGLQTADGLVKPISGLVQAAEQVGTGNLNARVDELPDDDEMAMLSRAFNRMIERLQTQQKEVTDANYQLDRRRRFTEAVLDSATAGILRVDSRGFISLTNRTVVDMLSWDGRDVVGDTFGVAVPEMMDLVAHARAKMGRTVEAQIEVSRQTKRRTLLVHAFGEYAETGDAGVVVTFDDITDLLSAQRTAAWADVARRIAHEIKNPLTPIQLSAERLKRKYSKQISDDLETFEGCIDTIRRQVSAIGNLIDEFSSFARMPAPNMARENVLKIIRDSVFLYQQLDKNVQVQFHSDLEEAWSNCDSRLIGQVMTNLLKNALESLQEKQLFDQVSGGRIRVTVGEILKDQFEISVSDNGLGLPPKAAEQLTEPYVTTKKKGTGLGLAIAHKIIEDHAGRFSIEPAPGGGAMAKFTLQRSEIPSKVGVDSQASQSKS